MMGARYAVAIPLAALLASGCGDPSEAPPCEGQGNICLVAGTPGKAGYNGDGSAPEATQLNLPSAVRVGPDGLLYIMDFNNMRLRCRVEDGSVDTVAGNGVHAYAIYNQSALSSPFENPIDFDFLPDGRIVIASLHDPRISIVDADDTLVLIAGTGDAGDAGDGLTATNANFQEISAVTAAPDGSIFISDGGANRVRVVRPDGNVYAYAGTGEAGDEGDDGPAVDAKLSYPQGLALDAAGNLFVADAYNHRVRRIDAETGIITTVAGRGGSGALSGDGGPAVDAELRFPRGVAIAPDGRLYIADSFNHRVRRIEEDGTIVTVAGTTAGYGGDGGPADQAKLKGPAYIEVTDDALYIPDMQNQVVRVMHLADSDS